MKSAMLLTILLAVMIVISIALTGLVLMQRSEGGALGMGGGPSGFMSARGAGNLLTTLTWWVGGAFAACAILLTVVGNMERANTSVLSSDIVEGLDLDAQSTAPAATAPVDGAPAAPTDTGPTLEDLAASASTPAAPAQPAPAE